MAQKIVFVLSLIFCANNLWSQEQEQRFSLLPGINISNGIGYQNPGYLFTIQYELRGKRMLSVFSEVGFNSANKYVGRGYSWQFASQVRLGNRWFVGGGIHFSQTRTDWIKTGISPLFAMGRRDIWFEYQAPNNTINRTQALALRTRFWRFQTEVAMIWFKQDGKKYWGCAEKFNFELKSWRK